jgi:HAD superfamily hydrolase (TIGR01549 family)
LIDDLECRQLIEAEARYQKELEVPYEGAEQTLRTLSSRYRIGVIANQSVGTAERLTEWGLMPFILICLSFAEVGLEKPDPAIFLLALSQSGCEPEQAVTIGDRLDHDIRPARLLGWKTVRTAQGFGRARGYSSTGSLVAVRNSMPHWPSSRALNACRGRAMTA